MNARNIINHLTISLKEARYLNLHSQLLLGKPEVNSKRGLLNIIERLGYIQIDTISIIERAHKHILWTRFPGFKNEMLDDLIDKDKKVIEFWDHAAAYLPAAHYRFTLPRKQMYRRKYLYWEKKNKKLLKFIFDRIKNEGPLQSRDFDNPSKRGLWWDWKPAKEGLEYLFHTGMLTVKARKNFQKVYDLPERTLPADIDDSFPSDDEYSAHMILKAINANGFASEREITYLRYYNKKVFKDTLNKLTERKEIIPLKVHGTGDELYYTHSEVLNNLNGRNMPGRIHILSPFDNLVIQRKRLSKIFGFDYVIECYLPAGKRKYGYFCMPVLKGDKFIGRLDAKANRQKGVFEMINFFTEGSFNGKPESDKNLSKKLVELSRFSGCSEIIY